MQSHNLSAQKYDLFRLVFYHRVSIPKYLQMVDKYERLCGKSIGVNHDRSNLFINRRHIFQWKVDVAFLSFYLSVVTSHDTLHLVAKIPNIYILLKNGRYLLIYEAKTTLDA